MLNFSFPPQTTENRVGIFHMLILMNKIECENRHFKDPAIPAWSVERPRKQLVCVVEPPLKQLVPVLVLVLVRAVERPWKQLQPKFTKSYQHCQSQRW